MAALGIVQNSRDGSHLPKRQGGRGHEAGGQLRRKCRYGHGLRGQEDRDAHCSLHPNFNSGNDGGKTKGAFRSYSTL